MVFFPPLSSFFENPTKSCIKLNTLEPFEDQDLPVNEFSGSEEEEIITVVLGEDKQKWDCESICSKYPSVYFTAESIMVIFKVLITSTF